MQQVQEIANAQIAKMQSDGTIEKLIQKNVEASVEKAISEVFRSYGDVTKKIQEGVESALQVNLDFSGIPAYTHIINDAVNNCVKKHLSTVSTEKLISDLEKSLSPAPKECTLEQLIMPFIEEMRADHEYMNIDYADLTVSRESDYGYVDISLGKGDGSESLEIKIDEKNKISWIDHGRGKQRIGMYSLRAMDSLMQKYLCGTVVVDAKTVDADDIDTCLNDY